MAKKLIMISLLLILACPFAVQAQDEAPLSIVSVDLWPEFDRPSMLVIYHITLSAGVDLPFQMSLRIPSLAGAPHAVAVRQPGGALISIPYEQESEDGWSRITFQATTPEVQVEFYDPSLSKEGSSRSYVYTWPGDYATNAFSVEVQKPAGATEMNIKPGMVTSRQGDDGLTYYTMGVGPLTEGQVFEITVEYQKESDDLSVSEMPVEPSAPLEGTTTGNIRVTSILPVILGIVGFVLIAGGAIWYWQSGRQKDQPKREYRRRKTSTAASAEETEDSHVYCHQCGKRASPGDRFCRTCGTALRLG